MMTNVKAFLKLCVALSVLMALSSAPVSAYVIDGLVNDWGINLSQANNRGYLDTHLASGGRDIDIVTEDNTDAAHQWVQVYPGWSYANNFDAEAMYFDNDDTYAYLAVITGLPINGYQVSGQPNFRPGDIGFDLNNDKIYEYALNIRDSNLYSVSSWNDVYYPEFTAANPWTMKTGISQGAVDFVYSGVQNTHYVMEAKIPLSLMGNSGIGTSPLNVHWAIECGNDVLNLAADTNKPVPEPSTLILLITGFLGSIIAFARKRYHAIQRPMDIVIASVALVVTSPLVLCAAILIKLTSPGPIFYKQVRVGVNRRRSRTSKGASADDRRSDNTFGQPFTIYKLRSMSYNAESKSGPVWAQKNDVRVTWIGRILRKTRVDEIPQFINVIKGEMSIVGPRPERPVFVKQLNENIKHYHRRFDVKPGITGLAQVQFAYASSIEDTRKKLKYDLLYTRRKGLLMDMDIFLNTLRTIIFAKGAR